MTIFLIVLLIFRVLLFIIILMLLLGYKIVSCDNVEDIRKICTFIFFFLDKDKTQFFDMYNKLYTFTLFVDHNNFLAENISQTENTNFISYSFMKTNSVL